MSSPILAELLRKMSAKEGAMTTPTPICWIAQTACSREEPPPKLGPARRMGAPAYSGRLTTKSGSLRQLSKAKGP